MLKLVFDGILSRKDVIYYVERDLSLKRAKGCKIEKLKYCTCDEIQKLIKNES